MEYRTAISRAYYCIYHTARELLNEQLQFFCKSGGNEHQWLQRHFANCSSVFVQSGTNYPSDAQRAKEADYKLNETAIETQAEAKLSLERAENTRKLLEQCASAANLPTIKAEMLQYRKLANVQ